MIWLASLLVLFALAVGVRVLHARAVNAEREVQRKRLTAHLRLAETGMELHGDVLENYELRGSVDGIQVSLKRCANLKMPGSSTETKPYGLVEVDAAMPDLILCKIGDVDAVMGPIPAVSRTLTGDTELDARYALFIAAPTGEIGSSFRTAQGADRLSWAKPAVLRQCVAQDVCWLRARDGRCELVLHCIRAEHAYVAFMLGVNLARAAAGRPLLEMPPTPAVEPRVDELLPWWLVATTALFLGFFPGSLLLFIPWGFDEHSWTVFIPAMAFSAIVFVVWIAITFARWILRPSRGAQIQ